MKITRDGKEIELTEEERLQAYYEQEHEFDTEDIKDEVERRCDGEDEREAALVEELLADADRLSKAADQKRELIDGYNMGWKAATEEAVDETITRLAESKEDAEHE